MTKIPSKIFWRLIRLDYKNPFFDGRWGGASSSCLPWVGDSTTSTSSGSHFLHQKILSSNKKMSTNNSNLICIMTTRHRILSSNRNVKFDSGQAQIWFVSYRSSAPLFLSRDDILCQRHEAWLNSMLVSKGVQQKEVCELLGFWQTVNKSFVDALYPVKKTQQALRVQPN